MRGGARTFSHREIELIAPASAKTGGHVHHALDHLHDLACGMLKAVGLPR
jgi:hypothetical protein